MITGQLLDQRDITETDFESLAKETVTLEEVIDTIETETGDSIAEVDPVEVEDNAVITLEYVNKTMEDLKSMNYIELIKFRKSLIFEKENLQSIYSSVSQFKELERMVERDEVLKQKNGVDPGDDLAVDIARSNLEEMHRVFDIEKFRESYPVTMERVEQLIVETEAHIERFRDVTRTAKFINEQSMEIVEKRIDRLSKIENPSVKRHKIYFANFKQILENQTEVAYFLESIPKQEISLRRLQRDMKKDKNGQMLKAVQKNVSDTFLMMFSATNMDAFETYLTNLFGDDDTVFYLQYALYLIYKHEKEYGKRGWHKWVEVLIMNTVNCAVGYYDLEGGKEDYDQKLLSLKECIERYI